MQQARVRWQLTFTDRFGVARTEQEGLLPIQPQRFGVTDLGTLQVDLPNEQGLATLALWLEEGNDTIRCRNYVNLEVRREQNPAVEPLANGWALRFAPGLYTQTSWQWPIPFSAADGAKFSAQGSGWVAYELALPSVIDRSSVRRLRLLVEASARAGMAKVDWPQQTAGFNYPQTEIDQQTPSTVQITINDLPVGQLHLPDDPADARGVLSHYHGVDPGAYGERYEVVIEGEILTQLLNSTAPLKIRFTVPPDAQHRHGFALYGETTGGYPLGPTLIVETT